MANLSIIPNGGVTIAGDVLKNAGKIVYAIGCFDYFGGIKIRAHFEGKHYNTTITMVGGQLRIPFVTGVDDNYVPTFKLETMKQVRKNKRNLTVRVDTGDEFTIRNGRIVIGSVGTDMDIYLSKGLIKRLFQTDLAWFNQLLL